MARTKIGAQPAIELAPYKICINVVAPAVVETPVYNTFMSDEQVKATLPTFNAFHPLGRNGRPRDVARRSCSSPRNSPPGSPERS